MKTYFEYKGFKIQDYKDKKFAQFTITDKNDTSNRCFDDLAEAICYTIGLAEGCCVDSKLKAYVDTFITMIRKNFVDLLI